MDDKNQVYVFYLKLPSEYTQVDVKTKSRNLEIEEVNNEDVKKEKTYAWLLLLYAIKKVYGYSHSELNFEKLESGKWVCDKCYFSISHRKEYVVVAISLNNVGVDIEQNNTPIKDLLLKISNDKEKQIYDNSQAIELWTKKESLFKLLGEKRFFPKKLNTEDYCFKLVDIEDYIISIATKQKINTKVCKINNHKDVLC